VLSACETGLSTVYGRDDVAGFTSAVLALGTRAVVSSVGAVDDEATAALMVDLHRRLRGGAAPAAALAAAQVATATDPCASTYGFVCFGPG
jgi:CHAT domain-containing protein